MHVDSLFESGEPWFAAAQALLVGVAVALAVGLAMRLLARRLLRDEDRAQRTSLLAFWGVVAIFGLIALTRLLGGEAGAGGLDLASDRLFQTVPDLIIALVLIVAGSIMASAARSEVLRRLAPYRPKLAEPLSSAAGIAILVLAVLLGTRQIGVQTALIEGLVLLLAAAVLLGAALAAGAGGRGVAAAYAAGRHAGDILTVGDLVELDGRRGRVVRLGPTSVRLHLDGGATAEVPNTVLLGQTVLIFEHEDPVVRPPSMGAPHDAASGDDEQPTVITTEVEVEVDGDAATRTFDRADAGTSAEPEPTAVLDRSELRRAAAARDGEDVVPSEDEDAADA